MQSARGNTNEAAAVCEFARSPEQTHFCVLIFMESYERRIDWPGWPDFLVKVLDLERPGVIPNPKTTIFLFGQAQIKLKVYPPSCALHCSIALPFSAHVLCLIMKLTLRR